MTKHTYFFAIGRPHAETLGWDEVAVCPLGPDFRDFLVSSNSTLLLDLIRVHLGSTREGRRKGGGEDRKTLSLSLADQDVG